MDRGISFLIAFAIALPLTAVARVVGLRLGFVDDPTGDELKIHRRQVPVLGGLAVVVAALGALALTGHEPRFVVIAAAGIALAAGLVDDVRRLPPAVQAALQIAAGLVLVVGGIDLGGLGAFGPPTVLALVVAGANSVNFIDGQDGLAGGLVAIACLGLAGVAAGGAPLALAVAGGLAAFLFWNRSPARIFLGNGGAHALGTILAVLAIGAIDADGWRGFFAATLCLGIFAFELAFTVVRRLGSRSLSVGDRLHSYDLFAAALGSRGRATLVFWILGAVAAGLGVAARYLPTSFGVGAAAAVSAVAAIGGYRLWSRHSGRRARSARLERARSYVG
ncbi:MAG: MraY family glycosyltransferase [Thermoleophilia bacterium]